jgi:prepilin-type N-terminal cleavage/methylation domain-containing protein
MVGEVAMNRASNNNTIQRRGAFTLIELLVVMALIAVLGTLTIAIVPVMSDQARAANGASQVQGWLHNMRHKAIRDRQARGVRFYVKAGTTLVTDAQYIEQPDDLGGNSISALTNPDPNLNLKIIQFGPGTDLFNNEPGNQNAWLVQPGDYLEVFGGGLMHQIQTVTANTVTLASPMPYAFSGVKQYRIIRQPVTSGDEPLTLPNSVAIDVKTNADYGNSLSSITKADGTGFYIDVLFSPSGAVVAPGFPSDTINLWVRDVSDTLYTVFDREPTIIAVNVRTGLVAAHPADPTGATPYTFVNDGRASGM